VKWSAVLIEAVHPDLVRPNAHTRLLLLLLLLPPHLLLHRLPASSYILVLQLSVSSDRTRTVLCK
jgi:hypothetical protein